MEQDRLCDTEMESLLHYVDVKLLWQSIGSQSCDTDIIGQQINK